MKKIYPLALLIGLAIAITSCNKDPEFNYYYYTPDELALLSQHLNLPEVPYDFTLKAPSARFLKPIQSVDRDMVTLGLVLFYDKKLSKDGKVACANCHKQENAFGDNAPVSTGVFGRTGSRNSIALMSVSSFSAEYGEDLNGEQGKRFFWDNRAPTAAEQSIGSMTDSREMDMTMEEVVAAVQSQPYYEPLFKKAFGTFEVSEEKVTGAIAAFVNSLGSLNSRFDVAAEANLQQGFFDVVNNPFSKFTAQENRGKEIYMVNCGVCHGFDQVNSPSLIDFTNSLDKTSNGLDAVTTDRGVGAITGDPADEGTFKIPTLRNIALSAPYMHDGRFATLEDVVEHYNSGIQAHDNLASQLRNSDGTPKRLNLSSDDKQALIAFLSTLTDSEIIKDVRFSNPFKQ